jgi:hypothetical protein
VTSLLEQSGDPVCESVRDCILSALREPGSLVELTPERLDLTLRLLRRVRLLGRVAIALDSRGLMEQLPPIAADQLASALVVAEARARAGRWELDRLAWALAELPDVPLVALKGCAYLLAGTPNAAGRTFSDVDLLVPEADLPRVERALVARGWRATELDDYDEHYYRAWAHELPPFRHLERDLEVDLHHNLLMRTARLKPSAGLLFDAARDVPGSRFKVLAPEDMVLHAMTHLFYGSDLADSLRELVDLDDLLRHFSIRDDGFWDGFWARAVQLDLERPAFYGLKFARDILDVSVPDEVLAAAESGRPPRVADRLMAMAVPGALIPHHPDGQIGIGGGISRLGLHVRSHWIKMPWPMLARHLAVKVCRRVGGDFGSVAS